MSLFIALLLLTFLIQAVFYCLIFTKLSFYKQPKPSENLAFEPVSVIICAKDEQENLTKYLESILTQDYPDFEVIVVDDNSSDNTWELLKNIETKYRQLRIIKSSTNFNHLQGKKQALASGMEAAKHKVVLLTDADCSPSSNNWLKEMYLVKGDRKMVLGYAPFYSRNNLLSAIVRYENLITAQQYLSFALIKHPYMGVGRNLMYDKSLFSAELINRGLASGDDDLLVNAKATSSNTGICIDKDAFMFSHHPVTIGNWIRQKRRHYSTGVKYKLQHKILLATFLGSKCLMYLFLLIGLITLSNIIVVCAVYFTYLVLLYLVSGSLCNKLKNKDLKPYIPLLDISYIASILIGLSSTIIPTKSRWKKV